MSKEDLNIPEPDMKDIAHTGVTTFLSSIPGVAGLGELFKLTFASSLEKRNKKWMEAVRDMLLAHDSKFGLTVNDLGQNEELLSLLLSATQAANRTHLDEKRNAFKNILFNSLQSKITYDLSENYIDLISRLTPLQMQILNLIKDMPKPKKVKSTDSEDVFYIYLCKRIEPDVEMPLMEAFVKGIEQMGLITHRLPGSSRSLLGDGHIYPYYTLNVFGRRFLEFIGDPE